MVVQIAAEVARENPEYAPAIETYLRKLRDSGAFGASTGME